MLANVLLCTEGKNQLLVAATDLSVSTRYECRGLRNTMTAGGHVNQEHG